MKEFLFFKQKHILLINGLSVFRLPLLYPCLDEKHMFTF